LFLRKIGARGDDEAVVEQWVPGSGLIAERGNRK
jgi:hypothetical protein